VLDAVRITEYIETYGRANAPSPRDGHRIIRIWSLSVGLGGFRLGQTFVSILVIFLRRCHDTHPQTAYPFAIMVPQNRDRTKAGMARAKEKGVKIGRPRLGIEVR
jgi:hypothetical protein